MSYLLYYFWLSPDARRARVHLHECGIEPDIIIERPWERRHEFLQLNPSGEVPVLVLPEGGMIAGAYAVNEYLNEVFPDKSLISGDHKRRAEIRRLVDWFDKKFYYEVTQNLLHEKIIKRLSRSAEPPNAQSIRAGAHNINYHLEYISWLVERRRWLAGEEISLADIVAACQLSCLDYVGDVPWDRHGAAKDWYLRIKCRPSFRPLLLDQVPGNPAAKHYDDLDF